MNLILFYYLFRWFCSIPMSDGFLVLAHIQNDNTNNKSSSSGIPSCFFVPRWLPNGERNPFYLQRLKDKLGNRANASSEVEFNNTQGVRINIFLKLNSIE
jgi:putative acyl-CoA dehydrogenase